MKKFSGSVGLHCTNIHSVHRYGKFLITMTPLTLCEPNLETELAEKRNRRKYHFSGSRFFRGIQNETKKKIYLLERKDAPTQVCAWSSYMHYGHKHFFSSSFRYFHLIFIRHKCLRYFFFLHCVSVSRDPFLRTIILVFLQRLCDGRWQREEQKYMREFHSINEHWALRALQGGNQ